MKTTHFLRKSRPTGHLRRSVFLLAAFFVLLTGAARAENLLENGSFEQLTGEGLPSSWRTDSYVQDAGYTVFSVSGEDAVDGEKAAAIRNIGANDARFAQTVRVKPESLYRFSGYIRTDGVEDGRGANLSIEGLYVFSRAVTGTSDGWQYIEWYGETGEDTQEVTLFARLGGYGGESRGSAWFDDLRLEEVTAVPGDGIADRWYSQKTLSVYDGEEDLPPSGDASPAWPRLILLSLAWTLLSVLILQSLRRARKIRPDLPSPGSGEAGLRVFFYAGLLLALAVRLGISYVVPGYAVDVGCFTSWGGTMASAGPLGFYPATNFCDYPPAYTYVLGLNALICRSVPGISEGMTRVVYRFFPALCDVLACAVLFGFLRRRAPRIPAKGRVWALLLLAFHPVSILNCAAWGQMDSVLALLLLLVAVWAVEGKWDFCLPCYMLAVLVKPQALMLGFLGLAAIFFAWFREPLSRKRILRGVVSALILMLVIVVPFSLRQSPLWIVDQYAGTLASYPYATVNTANFYYLLRGNWDAVTSAAHPFAAWILAALTLLYGLFFVRRARGKARHTRLELTLSALFAAWYVFCGFTGASWAMVGTASMAFAFVIVLSLYIRRGDVSFLPYLGGLLFVILYVFGVKMHERYIFPAFLLLALAFGLRRDRRILLVLLTLTCTTFINEGIVLDNSIRLGSQMGHLNQDTYLLAMILSAVNCAAAVYAVYLGVDLALTSGEEKPVRLLIRDPEIRDNRLHWRGKDTVLLCLILGVYSAVSFSTLGSTRAPQTAWTSTDYTEQVVLDLGESRDSFSMLYFARVSRYDFSVASSEDGVAWMDETWAQMDQGQCWKWKYVTESTDDGAGTRTYTSARHWFSGRYVRLTAHQINLALCEVIFRDPSGRILPIVSVERTGGDSASVLYSDPALLADEQDSMEGLPVWFRSGAAESEGEENPNVPQPSWWNSTYFDEIYHARTAWEFLNQETPYETTHPPLGKVLMSWSVAVFGMTPFGWRFAGALAGVAMLAVIYLAAKQMTKKTAPAAFACALFALDCMHLTQTQIATIDSFPVLFILLAFFFMLRFLQTDWRAEKRGRVLADLGLCGFSMGLAIASKWIGIYAGAGLAVLFFWHGVRTIRSPAPDSAARENPAPAQGTYGKAVPDGEREKGARKQSAPAGKAAARQREKAAPTQIAPAAAPKDSDALRVFGGYCLWSVLFFVIVPALIYLLSYLPYLAHRHLTNPVEYIQAVIACQQGMYNYHSTPGLGMDHPFYSPWYEWPVIGKPMFYATKQYIFNDELSFSIFCFGNPVIWWSGIPAMIFAAWAWIRVRTEKIQSPVPSDRSVFSGTETNLVFLLVGFLAQYLPWTLVPRGTYIYHYFASVPFLILALVLFFDQIRLRAPGAGKAAMAVFAGLALCAFILFFPYVTGILAPVSWLDMGKGLLKIWY